MDSPHRFTTQAQQAWKLVVLAALVLPIRTAHAQRGTVIGVVEDSSGVPIAAVSVKISGTDFGVATDVAGRFRFPSLEARSWKLDIRRLGYAPVTTEIEVRNGDTTSLSVVLFPLAVPIAPVLVSETDITPRLRAVGFERRRKEATTVPARQFVTRAQLEKQNPMRLSQVIDRMGRARGCVNPIMYVDGALRAPPPVDPPPPPNGRRAAQVGQPTPRPLPVDDIPPSEIEGLEVYVGSTQIPVEFKAAGRGGGCVMLIWTR